MALERGVFATTWIQATLRFLSLHTHSGGTCPAPNCTSTLVPSLPVDTLCRPTLVLIDNFIHACTNFSVSLFSYGHGLHSCFKSLWNHLFFFHLHLTAFSDSSCKIRVMIFWTTKLPIPVFIVFCEIPANRGREHARDDTRPALQPLVPPSYAEQVHLSARERTSRGKPVLIWFSHRNSRTLQFKRKHHIFFNPYPILNTWYCLWSDSWLVKGVWVWIDKTHTTTTVTVAAHARWGLITYIEMFHIHFQEQYIGQWGLLEALRKRAKG